MNKIIVSLLLLVMTATSCREVEFVDTNKSDDLLSFITVFGSSYDAVITPAVTGPTNASPITLTIVFDEPVTGFDASDITIGGTGSATVDSVVMVGADGTTYTITITPTADGAITVGAIDAAALKADGTSTGAVQPATVTYDTAVNAITASIASNNANNSYARVGDRITLSFTANEALVSPAATISGNAATVTGGPVNWTATYFMAAGDTEGLITYGITGIQDLAGNTAADISAASAITFDRTAPSIASASIASSNATTGYAITGDVVTLTFASDAAIQTPTVTISGRSITGPALVTADNINWTATCTMQSTDAQGTVVFSISNIRDNAGNTTSNVTATTDATAVTFDRTPPGVTINQAGGQADPTGSLPINFTVVFSEPIVPATFAAADINQTGTATGVTWALTNSGDDTTWTLTATGATGYGTVIPSIDADTVTDVAGNGNTANTSTDNSVFYCSDNNTISDITANPALSWDNAFAAAIVTYNINVLSAQATIDIAVTLADADASVTINGTPGLARTITLGAVGSTTTIEVIATSQCGTAGATYTLNVNRASPDINVQVGGSDVGTHDFGPSNVGVPVGPTTFTIQNTGTEPLTVTGYTLSAGDFAGTLATPVTIPGPGTTTFDITFTPTATGARTATIELTSDDPDEGTYTVTLNGTGTGPDINVQVGGSDVGTHDFGPSNVGVAVGPTTFTIQNTGTGPLTVSGYTLSAGDFAGTLATPVTIPGPGTTTFDITFTPTATGARTATIELTSDDPDEGTYTVTLNGTGTGPDINVQVGGSDVGTHDFGPSNVGVAVGPTTFTIQNTGTGPLTVSGYTLSAGDFAGTLATPVTIPGPGSATFDITFTPTATGLRTATIELTSDDPDEGTYTVTLNGTGTAPDINVQVGGSDVGTHDFGPSNVGVAVGPTTFTIQNIGDGPLTVSGYTLSAGDFAGTLATPVTIPGPGSATFDITFTPTATGLRTATIELTSDDPDEGTYTVTLNGTGTSPDINVQVGGSDVGTHDFGPSNIGVAVGPTTFTIQNTGTGPLTVSGYTLSAGDFAGTLATPVTIPGPGSATFDITFTPTATGLRTATIELTSDDPDEGTYTVTLNGTGTSPDINVQVGGSDVGTHDFGPSNIGVAVGPTTFTVQNIGDGPLTVSGYTLSAGDFAGTLATPVTIPGPGSATFDITFTPTATGLRTATIELTSDDPDEGTYTVTLNGTGTSPDINVQVGGSDVGTHDFGPSNVGVAVGPTTFTVQNIGDGPLTVSGFSVSVGDFSASTPLGVPVTIPGPGSATFEITFTPTATGARSATIELTSDDPDEGTYTVTLNGTGTSPDINVQVGGSDITAHDFGTVYQPLTSIPVAFTIQNTGGGSLNISGSSLSGANQSDFTVSGLTTGAIAAGSSRTFTIIFTPGGTGARTASLSISSDDPDENPYDITLSGTGGAAAAPEINLKIGAADYPSGTGACDFGQVYPGSAKTITFTIENTGAGTLTLSGAPLTGTGDFLVEGPDFTSIPGYGSVNVTVTFIPPSAGTFTDTLTINSDDADEAAYVISLDGTGSAAAVPDIDVSINGTEYLAGSTYDFGDIQQGDSGVVTLTITNSGSTDLNIISDAMNAGTNYSEGGPASTLLIAGSSTTLDVTFSPTAAGVLTDYIQIGSDDADEPAYQINFTGNGALLPTPDISVEAVAVTRPSGSCFDFEALYGGTAVTVVFTIENLGNATLDLYAPYVALNGHNAGDYSIIAYPSSTSIAPSGVTTFEIEFGPGAKGLREASIMIPSNDPDEETYIVNLKGLPVIPLMMVHGGWTADTSVYDPTTNTFSAGIAMTDVVDAGGHSFLVDSGAEAGKYMVIHGAGGTGTTLYDPAVPPAAPTVSGAYPTVANIDSGAHSFQITGGAYIDEYLVVCGGTTTINLFNPATPGFEDATPYGINLGSTAYTGSFHFTNDDNDMVVINGNNSAGYRVFDQDGTNTFGALQSIPSAQIWEGGHGTRIVSGTYAGYMLIIEGGLAGSNLTWLFDPTTAAPAHVAGPNLTGTAFGGSFSIPIVTGPYAGRILIVHGNNTVGTSIYNSVDNTMTAGPNLPTVATSGAFCFEITGGAHKGWYKIMHSTGYLDTTLFNPETMLFTDEGETLLLWVGLGASTFPAR